MKHAVIEGETRTEYRGFKPFTSSSDEELRSSHRVVLVWLDGEPDLWLVEDELGLNALKKKYERAWGPGRVAYTMLEWISSEDSAAESKPKRARTA